MAAVLQLAGLRKRYGALVVTDDVTVDVAEGEAVGIIGPNGAGKSTLFNLVTGDARPDAGVILFGGDDIGRQPPYARARAGIGRSYQIPLPFAHMTVFENCLVGAAFAGRGRVADPRRYCGYVLGRTGLLGKADSLAASLTLLERKRLELARALCGAPRLLLLDEIAGGLTDLESHALVGTIQGVLAGGVTIVWIEHVLHALLPVVSRLLVLDAGKLLADGEPRAILALPAVREIYLGIEPEPVAA